MAASPVIQVDPRVIEEIADRLSDAIVERVIDAIRAEGLIPYGRTTAAWLSAREVAERLGVSREWVYEHANELGASRIGSGRRPRLRFPPQILDAGPAKHTLREAANRPSKDRAQLSSLIPIHAS